MMGGAMDDDEETMDDGVNDENGWEPAASPESGLRPPHAVLGSATSLLPCLVQQLLHARTSAGRCSGLMDAMPWLRLRASELAGGGW